MKVVCLLPARNAAADLPGWLASAARVADSVVALDDGSTDGTRELLEASPLVEIVLTNPRRETYHGWHDGENRNRLLAAAGELEPDWIVSLDADDRMPGDEAEALRDFVGGNALPGLAYGLRYYRMWGERHYDPKGTWMYRLFAWEQGQVFTSRRNHNMPIPTSIPPEAWLQTTLRIQHFGASDEARRLARLEKYEQARGDVYEIRTDQMGLDDPPAELAEWQPRPPGRPVLFIPRPKPG